MVDSQDWTSAKLLNRFCSADATAADAIFNRYATRLIHLVQSRLSPRLARRTDAEDVALSAWRSFFLGARNDRYELAGPGDLWRLLAGMTMHKLYHQVRFHQADRRSVDREQSPNEMSNAQFLAPDQRVGVEDELALTEELEAIRKPLDDQSRRVFELRLQGEEIAAIARMTGCSERTIRRTLSRIRASVAARFELQTGQKSPGDLDHRQVPSTQIRKSQTTPAHTRVDAHLLLSPGDFLLERMLGAGRFGKVYRARRLRDNATMAIKYLRKAYLSEPAIVERFVQEARTLAELDHPGIVGIHGLGKTAAGSYFLVMEWIDGPNLAEVLKSALPASNRVVRWMLALCDALGHAHERAILHCDLKPNNLLIDRVDAIHVTDFGLARPLAGDPKLDRRIEGTPAFMAPEQASAAWGSIGIQTDIYGLGAVLYALLTGRPPSAINNQREVGLPVPVIDPRGLRPDISQSLAQICMRCLASNPGARFQSTRELRLALEHLA
ncbi:hypothetical protein BH10PLA2_BH10PLA2_36080 [soil metagenome]